MRRSALLAVALLIALPLAAVEGPPPEVLERVPEAFAFLDGGGFVGSYRLTAQVVAKVPGEDEDELEEILITIHPDGTKESRLVRALEHGRDVTAERRRAEGEVEVEEPSGGDHSIELDEFGMLPVGANRRFYAFEDVRTEDGLTVVAFAPLRQHRKRDDLARGSIAWDPRTQRPAWFEIEPNDRPPMVKEMTMRFEFDELAGRTYPSRILTHARAGLPLFRVNVDVDITITDVQPAS